MRTFTCSKCGVVMEEKDNIQNPGPANHYHFYVDAHLASWTLSVETDKGRPVGEGYLLREGSRQFVNTTDEERRKFVAPSWIRRKPAKDAVLRITISDHPADPQTPYETMEGFFKSAAFLSEQGLDKQMACRLTDGHDWVEQLPVAP